jgi:hypothetical protein
VDRVGIRLFSDEIRDSACKPDFVEIRSRFGEACMNLYVRSTACFSVCPCEARRNDLVFPCRFLARRESIKIASRLHYARNDRCGRWGGAWDGWAQCRTIPRLEPEGWFRPFSRKSWKTLLDLFQDGSLICLFKS